MKADKLVECIKGFKTFPSEWITQPNVVSYSENHPEHVAIKCRRIMDLYVGVGWANRPSPVLLFESKPIRSLLYESLVSSIVRQHSEIAFWSALAIKKQPLNMEIQEIHHTSYRTVAQA